MTDWSPEARRTRIAVREALKWVASRTWIDVQYPAPPPLTRTVPREVDDPHETFTKWRVVNGVTLEIHRDDISGWCLPTATWFTAGNRATPDRRRMWDDLWANPTRTEPVDDE